jgi:hypothetical protein
MHPRVSTFLKNRLQNHNPQQEMEELQKKGKSSILAYIKDVWVQPNKQGEPPSK